MYHNYLNTISINVRARFYIGLSGKSTVLKWVEARHVKLGVKALLLEAPKNQMGPAIGPESQVLVREEAREDGQPNRMRAHTV